MDANAEGLLDPAFLFRFAFPCYHSPAKWTAKGLELPPRYRLPALAALGGGVTHSELRVAWNAAGLLFTVRVHKQRAIVGTDSLIPSNNDGIQLCLDTRDTKSIHRAGRFCHRFAFLASGAGGKLGARAAWLPVERAKEHPRAIDPEKLKVHCRRFKDGYRLSGHIPGELLTGYDNGEFGRLGFAYHLRDHEHPDETSLGCEARFPLLQDPSIWATLELQPPE